MGAGNLNIVKQMGENKVKEIRRKWAALVGVLLSVSRWKRFVMRRGPEILGESKEKVLPSEIKEERQNA